MRVLICGSRDFTDIDTIKKVIELLPKNTVIIHGAAPGADSIAGKIAEEKGMMVLSFPADWKKYGRSAGPIRNKQMLVEGKPDIVYAFFRDKKESKGTKNMVQLATRAGIKVIEHESISKT